MTNLNPYCAIHYNGQFDTFETLLVAYDETPTKVIRFYAWGFPTSIKPGGLWQVLPLRGDYPIYTKGITDKTTYKHRRARK